MFVSFSGCFDFVDGIAARYFDQCSKFGAIFDIVIDNMTRTVIWFGAIEITHPTPPWMYCAALLTNATAWTTMVATQVTAIATGFLTPHLFSLFVLLCFVFLKPPRVTSHCFFCNILRICEFCSLCFVLHTLCKKEVKTKTK